MKQSVHNNIVQHRKDAGDVTSANGDGKVVNDHKIMSKKEDGSH
jgi:hypothetical protein